MKIVKISRRCLLAPPDPFPQFPKTEKSAVKTSLDLSITSSTVIGPARTLHVDTNLPSLAPFAKVDKTRQNSDNQQATTSEQTTTLTTVPTPSSLAHHQQQQLQSPPSPTTSSFSCKLKLFEAQSRNGGLVQAIATDSNTNNNCAAVNGAQPQQHEGEHASNVSPCNMDGTTSNNGTAPTNGASIASKMGGNQLTQLPLNIGDLQKLAELVLCEKHLPSSVGQLKRLEVLKASKNNLTVLNPSICSCSLHTDLILCDNQLQLMNCPTLWYSIVLALKCKTVPSCREVKKVPFPSALRGTTTLMPPPHHPSFGTTRAHTHNGTH
ncbi:hypothetical protein niasHT_000096 [Heterodera trifolii]|uniref:Uncharacterized protein n=1 Tax=Heterodera trifolii TaxID=157864 RepID=A0ABD2M414_9BILA